MGFQNLTISAELFNIKRLDRLRWVSSGIPRRFLNLIAESRLWIMSYVVGVLGRRFVPNAASCAGQSYIECEVKSQDQSLQRAQ
ncbi:hypothetical protein GGP41_003475 [Bipolaris sorokiniana]|uniref:Uncharacterized protein n=1 Tax=Cochliobolus sativus TaxID=45130 RepID=A0A8H6DTA8_COCSA|nr:hypothetical protein GGP41_003475 [Bipolaris sorokiniana]